MKDFTKENFEECVSHIKANLLHFVDDKQIKQIDIKHNLNTFTEDKVLKFNFKVVLDSKWIESPFEYVSYYCFSDACMFNFELENPYLNLTNRFIRREMWRIEEEFEKLDANF